jgi:hypothetical protein
VDQRPTGDCCVVTDAGARLWCARTAIVGNGIAQRRVVGKPDVTRSKELDGGISGLSGAGKITRVGKSGTGFAMPKIEA